MEILLALAAALLFALGTVLQQKAGLDEPVEGEASGLLLRMARRPVWLAGIAADALGFVAQAVALTIGRLAVVQPPMTGSPFAVRHAVGTSRISDVMFLSSMMLSSPFGGPTAFVFTRSNTSPRFTENGSLRWPTKSLPGWQPGIVTL